jgi:hypothetical protein
MKNKASSPTGTEAIVLGIIFGAVCWLFIISGGVR